MCDPCPLTNDPEGIGIRRGRNGREVEMVDSKKVKAKAGEAIRQNCAGLKTLRI